MHARQHILLCDAIGTQSTAAPTLVRTRMRQSKAAQLPLAPAKVACSTAHSALPGTRKLRLHQAAPSGGHLEEVHVGRVRLVRRMARLAHEHLPSGARAYRSQCAGSAATSRSRCGTGEPSPGAVWPGRAQLVQMWPRVKCRSAPFPSAAAALLIACQCGPSVYSLSTQCLPAAFAVRLVSAALPLPSAYYAAVLRLTAQRLGSVTCSGGAPFDERANIDTCATNRATASLPAVATACNGLRLPV